MSGKSNSVSGNYTCRVELVQTQLRCKTRGEGCGRKSTGFLSITTTPTLMHCCVVQCSSPPTLLLCLSLSPSLSSFSPLLPPAQSVCEDKKSPVKDTSFKTAPCCMETGRTARRGKQELKPSRTAHSLHPNTNLFMKLHEYKHYMLLKFPSLYMKYTARLSVVHVKLLNLSMYLRKYTLLSSLWIDGLKITFVSP